MPSVYSSLGQQVEVTEPPVVPRARGLGWSREAAATTLVARLDVTPFGRLPSFSPSRTCCHDDLATAEGSMKQDKRKGNRQPPQLATINRHAADIDSGAQEHWVAVPAESDLRPVRRFGAYTADLQALADWLQQCEVTTVAMESTGGATVYWIPLFELLPASISSICRRP